MTYREILVSVGRNNMAIGNIWRVVAKHSDFYIEPLSDVASFHLSIHGPPKDFPSPRFHIRVERKEANTAHERGVLAAHSIPRKGVTFTGRKLSDEAFLVARIRWTWQVRRERYRQAAIYGGWPEVAAGVSGYCNQSR